MEIRSSRCPLVVSLGELQRFGSALSLVGMATRNLSRSPTCVRRGSLVGQGRQHHLERCRGNPKSRPQLQRGCIKGHGQRDSLPEIWLRTDLSLRKKPHGFCSDNALRIALFH